MFYPMLATTILSAWAFCGNPALPLRKTFQRRIGEAKCQPVGMVEGVVQLGQRCKLTGGTAGAIDGGGKQRLEFCKNSIFKIKLLT